MKQRFVYQVITDPKSAPAGVDWLMIDAVREIVRTRNDLQKRVPADLDVERLEKQPLVKHHAATMAS